MKIKITNLFNKPLEGLSLEFIPAKEYTHTNASDIYAKTNSLGEADVNISKGYYIMIIDSRYNQIIEFKDNLTIKIPKFSFFLFGKDVSSDEITELYNKLDKYKCFKCERKYHTLNKFSCRYCGRNYCQKHRLPESHDCWGNPQAPIGKGFREIHTRRGTYVKGKY